MSLLQAAKQAVKDARDIARGALWLDNLDQAIAQAEPQEPVAWSDDIEAMPFNTYCKAIVNWSSSSLCGESYLEGKEVEVIVVKHGMTDGSAYQAPKPRFVFLHTGSNQYRDTKVRVLKWKPLCTVTQQRNSGEAQK